MTRSFDQIDYFLEIFPQATAQENFSNVMHNATNVGFFYLRIADALGNDLGDDADAEGMLPEGLDVENAVFALK
jgi:hypothetical protein